MSQEFDHEKMTLTFVCGGVGPPLAVRVRRMLKAAPYAYGLKCVPNPPVETVKTDLPPIPPTKGNT